MFALDNNLIGGNGTTYDQQHINKEYACIDGKDGKPGYFCDELLYYGLENNLNSLTLYISNCPTEHSTTLNRSALRSANYNDCG